MLEFHIRSGTYWKDKRQSAYENYADVKCSELLGVICISNCEKEIPISLHRKTRRYVDRTAHAVLTQIHE